MLVICNSMLYYWTASFYCKHDLAFLTKLEEFFLAFVYRGNSSTYLIREFHLPEHKLNQIFCLHYLSITINLLWTSILMETNSFELKQHLFESPRTIVPNFNYFPFNLQVKKSPPEPTSGGFIIGGDPVARVAHLEHSVRFLQEQHRQMLSGLHAEIEALRERNRGMAQRF